jgi:Tfp pilus assembly protein FimT
MKLHPDISRRRNSAGILLVECMVYIAVFAILLGGATTVFYFCWDHSKAMLYATDDISSALRAGERWRADVRAATGKISVETTADGEAVKIPAGKTEILYLFKSGEVRRQIAPENFSQLLLAKVKTSQMKMDARDNATAWRWELELAERRTETHLPLVFTFEAAQMKP